MKYAIVFDNGYFNVVTIDEWDQVSVHAIGNTSLDDAIRQLSMMTGQKVIIKVELMQP